MLWRSNSKKNRTADRDDALDNKENPAGSANPKSAVVPASKRSQDSSSSERDEMLAQMSENEEARKVLEKIQGLRSSVNQLREQSVVDPIAGSADQKNTAIDEQQIRAAEQAVLKSAEEDARAARLQEEEDKRRQLQAAEEQRKALEAQERAARISAEAEQKRQEALEAERRAKEVSRKKALATMEAERKIREEAERKRKNDAENQTDNLSSGMASPEERAAFFAESEASSIPPEEQLKSMAESLQDQQNQQDVLFDAISKVTEEHTEQLQGSQMTKVRELADAQKEAIEEQKLRAQIQQLKAAQEKARAEAALRGKREQALHRAEEKLRRKEEVRQRRLERLARKRAEKARKLEAREQHKQEKRRIAEAKAKLEKQSRIDAKMGGGIVNVQGVKIETEVNKERKFSIRDFFGIRSKAEKQAASEEEQARLAEERMARQQEARSIVHFRSIRRQAAYRKSRFGQKMDSIKRYSEEHKQGMLLVFAVAMLTIVAAAGVLNYYRVYEYSYNGQTLGLVKEKDDVLQITDLVQTALTKDKDMKVIMDAKDDISFKWKLEFGGAQIDDSEQVLKRLTYMGDLKVKATAFYINGKKVGAVQDRDTADAVLKDISDKYTTDSDKVEIESVRFIENLDVKTSSIDLQNLYSEEEMVNILSTSGEKETLHKIVAGDTLHSIAEQYDVSEKQLLADNDGIDSKKLVVGNTLVVKQQAPLLTYEIVEKVTYDKTIKHKTEKKKSSKLYKGTTETKQKGSDGVEEVTARITTQNGEKISEKDLSSTTKKKAVTEVLLVGTKKRPPTIGSGEYIWPLKSDFTRTSGFGTRWGRMHKGIDLAVSVGTTVYAADGGTVIEAQYSGSYGNVVMIDHKNGQETRYAHNSQLLVKKGDKVYQGQAIAKSGNTGRSTGPHLHFEIRVNGEPKNPLNYLP